MDNPILILTLAALGFITVSTLGGYALALLVHKVIRRFQARNEGGWGFGERGVAKAFADGTFRTLSFEDLMAMKQNTEASVEEFWLQQEMRAYRLYGAGITREQ